MFVKVASTEELSPGQCKTVRAEGKMIALYNVGGTYYATDDVCAHNGGPLGEGTLEWNDHCVSLAPLAVRRHHRQEQNQSSDANR